MRGSSTIPRAFDVSGRAVGEVSVRRTADGTWYCRPYFGTDPATGRAIRPYRQFPAARDEAEALAMAREWVDGLRGRDLGAVLAAYVDDVASIGTRRGGGPKANTVRSYRTHMRRVCAALPGARADELTPRQVTAAYRRMLEPRERGGMGLSASTVAGTHWFLCAALRWAVRQHVVDSTPMADVDHPTAPPGPGERARALSAAEAAALDSWAVGVVRSDGPWDRSRRDALAIHLGLATGMRVGEVAALRRRDRRAEVPDLHVCGTAVETGGLHRQPTPKRDRQRRVAVAREDDDVVALALRAQGGLGPDSPIVTVDGELARPSDLNRALCVACLELGLPEWVHFHTLRHTHATTLLLAGENIRVVQERLGHADVATTLRLYGHVLPGRDAAAAERFRGALGGFAA